MDRFGLCPGEAFEDQPVVGIGTAFVAEARIMVTAAHCLSGPVENYAVIFGFEMVNQVGAFEVLIPADNIYSLQKILSRFDDQDMLIFEVDRQINRPALEFSKDAIIPEKTSVYMIGHPSGLPQKVALNAAIKGNPHPQYFYTSLDAFQGNSGSPVFRRNNHEVVGVLVSGGTDFQWNGHCNSSTICRIPYCTGEKVMRIEAILTFLSDRSANKH